MEELQVQLAGLNSMIVDAALGLETSFADTGIHYQEAEFMSMRSGVDDEVDHWQDISCVLGTKGSLNTWHYEQVSFRSA